MRHLLNAPPHRRARLAPWVALACTAALAACDTPSPEFRGVPAERVTVGPSTFSVRVMDDRAEAVRLTFEAGAVRGGPIARGVLAMERASGCRVEPESFEGDAAMMRADLDCG